MRGLGPVGRHLRVLGVSDPASLAGLAALAFVVRLAPILRHGGLGYIGRYDDGVYYAAADALSFGRIPYKQFILLHPPGIMLVVLPFVALGRLTTDLAGVEAARLAFMGLGAANTVLVGLITRRWGRFAMLLAALVYACWQPAVYAEQSTFLEPVGGCLVLIALYRLTTAAKRPTLRGDLVTGALLGLALTVKIWYVAPLATVVAWLLLVRRPSSAARTVLGAVGAVAVVVTPFAVLAGRAMDRMVLRDQLFRPVAVPSRLSRVPSLFGVQSLARSGTQVRHLLVAFVAALVVVSLAAALHDRATRLLFAVLSVNSAVLLISPVYLRHYASFIAGPAAILIGVGLSRIRASVRGRPVGVMAAGAVSLACLASAVTILRVDDGRSFPSAAFAAVAPSGCVAADDPIVLADINRLSSDLRDGCAVDVDVTGAILDRFTVVYPDGVIVPRRLNPEWQGYLYDYLTDARAFILCRQPSDGMTRAFARSYRHFRLVANAHAGHDQLRLGEASAS